MRLVLPLFLLSTSVLHAAAWRSSGPSGGVARVLAEAPSNPNVIYLASNGGVFRSADRGATWRDVSGPITTPNALAISPSDPNTVYASSGVEGRDVFKTTDGGASWTELVNGLPQPMRVTSILVDPRNENVVYVSSGCGPIFAKSPRAELEPNSGVYKSIDGGATFVDKSEGLDGFPHCVVALSFDPLDPDTLYLTPVFSDSGYGRSDDGAETWTLVKMRFPGTGSVADPRDTNRRYGIANGTFITSSDGGVTWKELQPRVLDGGLFPQFSATDIAIDPASGRIFVATQEGVYRSGDGGQSFLSLSGPAREPAWTLLFDRTTGALTIGTNTGVYRSSAYPWSEWTTLTTGDTSLDMRRVATSLRDPDTAYATSAGRVYVTRDAARTWQLLPELPAGPQAGVQSLTVDAAEHVYVRAYFNGTIWTFKYAAESNTWATLELPYVHSGDLFVDPSTPGVVYATALGTYLVTRNGGATWSEIDLPADYSYANSLAVDPRDGNVLYAITYDKLLRSADGGITWTEKPANVNSMSQVAISADGSTVYVDGGDAVAGRVLFRSTDRGETFTQVSQLPDGTGVLSMLTDPRNARTLYIDSVSAGVQRSVDGGATWHSLQAGLPSTYARLAISVDGTLLHAATPRGMWELNLTPRRRSVR